MELWTEYEGKTIDGAFPLKKLVQPQGRSAFFSTANGKGEPILIRLVACHFDEDEILARWRGVQALNHPNFLRLERYGQLELDATKVVYAAFEHTDANLAQVLAQGRLTTADVRQLAASLASALQMLHANGFIHEHLDAEQVFAVGEVVKLRTDCIRETPEGAEGFAAKQRDVRDLATIVLQALTQERTLEAAAAKRRALSAPFEELVPKAIAGEWGLAEIAAALQTKQEAARAKAAPPAAVPPHAPAPNRAADSSSASKVSAKPAPDKSRNDDPMPAALRSQALPGAWGENDPAIRRKKWIVTGAIAAVMLLLLWVGWSSISHTHAAHAQPRPTAASAASSVSVPHSSPASSQPLAVRSASREVWRVVAYTYNHRDQAQKKSAELAHRHPDLQPAVFSPTGHAPYLVTLGGGMNRDQAYALAHRSHRLGLPRDTYAQNYTSAH